MSGLNETAISKTITNTYHDELLSRVDKNVGTTQNHAVQLLSIRPRPGEGRGAYHEVLV